MASKMWQYWQVKCPVCIPNGSNHGRCWYPCKCSHRSGKWNRFKIIVVKKISTVRCFWIFFRTKSCSYNLCLKTSLELLVGANISIFSFSDGNRFSGFVNNKGTSSREKPGKCLVQVKGLVCWRDRLTEIFHLLFDLANLGLRKKFPI